MEGDERTKLQSQEQLLPPLNCDHKRAGLNEYEGPKH